MKTLDCLVQTTDVYNERIRAEAQKELSGVQLALSLYKGLADSGWTHVDPQPQRKLRHGTIIRDFVDMLFGVGSLHRYTEGRCRSLVQA